MTNGTRRGWGVSVMPWPLSTPGKDLVPIVQEGGWAPGPVWTGAENLAPNRIQSPNRPVCSQSLYWLNYPAYNYYNAACKYSCTVKKHLAKILISTVSFKLLNVCSLSFFQITYYVILSPYWHVYVLGRLWRHSNCRLPRGEMWRHRIRNWYVSLVSRDIGRSFSKR